MTTSSSGAEIDVDLFGLRTDFEQLYSDLQQAGMRDSVRVFFSLTPDELSQAAVSASAPSSSKD